MIPTRARIFNCFDGKFFNDVRQDHELRASTSRNVER